MKKNDIEIVTRGFREKLNYKHHRFVSFNFCYNHFFLNDPKADLEKSCLVLGFYLASWGMFRGSSFLLQKNLKHFQPTVEYIASIDKSVWEIDVDSYTDANRKVILDLYKDVKKLLVLDGKSDMTLVTKALLGVFGFIPAFDQYFCQTFREIYKSQGCSFRSVNDEALKCISDFYNCNRQVIDNISMNINTIDFLAEQSTAVNYPKAKIIDMYGFFSQRN
jgi:hypothetical protein